MNQLLWFAVSLTRTWYARQVVCHGNVTGNGLCHDCVGEQQRLKSESNDGFRYSLIN